MEDNLQLSSAPPADRAWPPIFQAAKGVEKWRTLRVLLVVESAAKGTGRHVVDLAGGLVDRGCDVHLLYSTGRVDKTFDEGTARIPGLRRVPLLMHRGLHRGDFKVVYAVRRYLRLHGPFDVIHGHSSKGGGVARLAALGSGVPSFYTPHGLVTMDLDLPPWKKRLYATIEAVLSRLCEQVIAVSPEEARAAVKLSMSRQRMVLVPNGVTPMSFAPREAARRVIGVDQDVIVIGFVGRLVDYKAPQTLLRAFSVLLPSAPHARLAIVGDGEMKAELEAMAERLGMRDKVIMLGERNACEVFKGFDIFAIPSRKEGLPYVVLEAMAAGLPVVASASAGVEILVQPGANGAIVPTNDHIALAAALRDLALDRPLMQRQGLASLENVKKFSADVMVERILTLYTRAADRREQAMEVDDEAQVAAS